MKNMKFLRRGYLHIMLIIGSLRRIIARYVTIAFGCRPLGDTKRKGKNFIGMMELRFQRNRNSKPETVSIISFQTLTDIF